jgi:hypothetical protein
MGKWSGALGAVALFLTAAAARADAPPPAPAAPSAPAQAAQVPAQQPAPATTDAPAPATTDAPAQPALAGVDDATRAAARNVAEEGLALYDANKYVEALDRFERADALVHAPTMGLMAARSLQRLGRFVEATERYLTVTRMQIDADASDGFRTALTDAARERDALLPRIAGLELAIDSSIRGTVVALDGKAVPAALVGVRRPIDPGPHVVVLTLGDKTKTERFELKEAEVRRIVVAFDPPSRPPLQLPPPPSRGGALRAVGWTGVAVGGAGVIVGVVAGGLALSAKSNLQQTICTGTRCPPAAIPEIDRYDLLRGLSSAGLIAGVITASAGALVVGISRPSAAPGKQGITWQPWIGPGTAGAHITF